MDNPETLAEAINNLSIACSELWGDIVSHLMKDLHRLFRITK